MDLSVYETGGGGDVILSNNDLEITQSIYNQVYLAWFGGNLVHDHSDEEERLSDEQRFGYWQNDLFFSGLYSGGKLSSELELSLTSLPLTSQGLYDLKKAAEEDLEFLSEVADITVTLYGIDVDKIEIIAKLQQSNGTDNVFKFVWDATKLEVINKIDI